MYLHKTTILLFTAVFFIATNARRHSHPSPKNKIEGKAAGDPSPKNKIEGRAAGGGGKKQSNAPAPPSPDVPTPDSATKAPPPIDGEWDDVFRILGEFKGWDYYISKTETGSRWKAGVFVQNFQQRHAEELPIDSVNQTEAENKAFRDSPLAKLIPDYVECIWINVRAKRRSPGLFDIVKVDENGNLQTIGEINENIKKSRKKRDAEGTLFTTIKQTLFPYIDLLTEEQKTKGCGATYPRCEPIECNVKTSDCQTETPVCTITAQPICSVLASQPCSASCESCNITQPTCYAVPRPCTVSKGRACRVNPPVCKVEASQECTTTRPPCTTFQPPCNAKTFPSSDGTNCVDPKCIDLDECQPRSIPGSTELSWEHCIKEEICLSPKFCTAPFVLCPAPETFCPPETTKCSAPKITCEKPEIVCDDPKVSCPPPTVKCTAPVISCASPLVRCPEVVATCTNAEFSCPPPKVTCPPPDASCSPPPPCELPPVPLPPPCPAPPGVCEECECIRLPRKSGWEMEQCHCQTQCHFLATTKKNDDE